MKLANLLESRRTLLTQARHICLTEDHHKTTRVVGLQEKIRSQNPSEYETGMLMNLAQRYSVEVK
jgi:hypothetical protein